MNYMEIRSKQVSHEWSFFIVVPFSHFAQHGLKLRERQIFRLEAPDIGELFHAALKYIADTVNGAKIILGNFNKETIRKASKGSSRNISAKATK